jgi:hypothetical protein
MRTHEYFTSIVEELTPHWCNIKIFEMFTNFGSEDDCVLTVVMLHKSKKKKEKVRT